MGFTHIGEMHADTIELQAPLNRSQVVRLSCEAGEPLII